MWKVAGVLVASFLLCLSDTVRLWRQKLFKELTVFLVLAGVASALCIATVLDIELSSPLEALRFVYEPVDKWIVKLLKSFSSS
ncbi:hypothetical protein [Paenibacillus tyrfis]|uniref:Uncharacterized protein n=1 Tax=Paenibacillus tyrfis TaxID=1501230 RepID=A0A081P1G9_9BACL|nr:hypothetical protein [Paenibacillus tyrfis]KEQ24542.1 hypothetical protein ET33_09725 [Paenibacillus tyrfis]